MKLIGLSGHAGCGKSTVAKIIQLADSWENSKYFKIQYPDKVFFIKHFIEYPSITADVCSDYKEIAFADPLKQCVSSIFDIPLNILYDQEGKKLPNTLDLADADGNIWSFREILQKFGTEVGRAIHPDLWIKALFKQLDPKCKYIISDIRYENEAEACLDAEATLIRINRNIEQMKHSSETSLDKYEKFTHIIDNNGSLEDLINNILNLNL